MATDLNSYAGEKVLVTGASGFIGWHLCRSLRSSQAEIHAVSRRKSPKFENAIEWWRGDLADAVWVERVLKKIKPGAIFHLAGEVTGSRNPDCVMPTFRSNLASTVNLLTAAREIGCRRFVLAGSLEEPDSIGGEAIPCSPYAAAKSACTAYARMFHSLYQLPVVILRIFMVYGPVQRDLQKLIPYVILSVLRGEAPKLSSGSRLVDWIYVEDVVQGLLMAGRSESIDGRTIDLGSGELVPIRKVVEMLVNKINPRITPLFGAIADRPLEQIRTADIAKSEGTLGWRPTTALADGLQRTVEWYRTHFSDLEGKPVSPAVSVGVR